MNSEILTHRPQPITRGELSQALELWLPLTADFSEPEAWTVEASPELAYIIAAEVFGWPMASIQLRYQVGRFVAVEYEPLTPRRLDPDILLVLEASPAARAFHQAMRNFQATRRDHASNPAAWYQSAKRAAQAVAGPLYLLRPSRAEAAFVIRWLLLTVAQGRRISDGLVEVRIYE